MDNQIADTLSMILQVGQTILNEEVGCQLRRPNCCTDWQYDGEGVRVEAGGLGHGLM